MSLSYFFPQSFESKAQIQTEKERQRQTLEKTQSDIEIETDIDLEMEIEKETETETEMEQEVEQETETETEFDHDLFSKSPLSPSTQSSEEVHVLELHSDDPDIILHKLSLLCLEICFRIGRNDDQPDFNDLKDSDSPFDFDSQDNTMQFIDPFVFRFASIYKYIYVCV